MEKINQVEKVLLFFLFYVLTAGLLVSYIDTKQFTDFYTKEDGVIEWLTVAALFCGGIVSFRRFFQLKNKKPAIFRYALVFFGIVFFFGVGEEISWGQRIFDVQPGEFFLKNNTQGETNVHNLMLGDKRINKIIFGTGLGIFISIYLLLGPYLYRTKAWAKNLVQKFAIPLPQGHHVIAYTLLFLISSLVVSGKRGELLELGGTTIFLMIVLFPLNKEDFK